MTNEDLPNKKGAEEKAPTKDSMLTALINLTNNAGLEIGITIEVHGIIISGITIRASEYYNAVADQVGKANTNSDIGQKVIDTMSQSYHDIAEELTKEETSDDLPDANYIHLKDVTINTPNGLIHPPLWRTSLSSVDGFTIGQWKQD
jgi:hypothetical protein